MTDLIPQAAFDFSRTHARRNDPDTSKRAALIAALRAGSVRAKIYNHLEATGASLSWEQLASVLGLSESSCWKRCSDLHRDGLIEPHGTTINRSGADATLYRVVGRDRVEIGPRVEM